ISAGVDEAAKLAKNFGIALSFARQIAKEQAGPEKPKLGYNLEGGGRNPIPNDVTNANLGYGNLINRGPSRTRFDVPNLSGSGDVSGLESGSGSSGGGRFRSGGGRGGREQEPLFSIAEKELENLQRSIEMRGKSKEEVAALTVKHTLLDEAKKRGLDITDELLQKIDAEAANVGKLA
ncbi:hypothetical protein, partial [Sulfitobacter sp. HI0027]|uniref:hypothetical protein n=1 Tax=Sulfitobacter sp. HI0027 TaxID=1822226 RepID=UPI00191BB8A9